MAIEEEFSIEIPDKDADAIHSGKSCSSCVHVGVYAWTGADHRPPLRAPTSQHARCNKWTIR